MRPVVLCGAGAQQAARDRAAQCGARRHAGRPARCQGRPRLQPLLHMVTASITCGYSLYYIWLPLELTRKVPRPLSHMVTASITNGYSLYHIWLQPLSHMVAASTTYGYSRPARCQGRHPGFTMWPGRVVSPRPQQPVELHPRRCGGCRHPSQRAWPSASLRWAQAASPWLRRVATFCTV